MSSSQTRPGGEKSLLGISKKSYGRSYGSTKQSTQDIYIKHIVSPSDTLAGIALKYSVSLEQIKRANKLYTNDSLFLRSTLSIPVGDQPLPAHVLENATSRANGSPIHKVALDSVLVDSSEEEEDGATEGEVEERREEAALPEENRDIQMDFFNRIDRQLRERKSTLDKIETSSSVSDIEAISPNVQASPAKKSSVPASNRAGPRPHPDDDDSYQSGAVTVATENPRRRAANDLGEAAGRGGGSKGKEGKVELVSCDEKEALTGGLPSNGKREAASVRLV